MTVFADMFTHAVFVLVFNFHFIPPFHIYLCVCGQRGCVANLTSIIFTARVYNIKARFPLPELTQLVETHARQHGPC